MTPLLSLASALAALLIPLTFGYGLVCWIWPFRACRPCHGTGRRLTRGGRKTRPCRPCKMTGRRLRAGRWIANHLTRIRSEAHR